MIRITIDESGASTEAATALREMAGYGEFMDAVKSSGRKLGIELVVIDRAQSALPVASRVQQSPPMPQHDMPAGTWVARKDSPDRPSIGKVVDAYTGMGELMLDIVLYGHDGAKIGRESPAMGGPRHHEPACGAENWEPIEQPDFAFLATKGFWGRHLKRLRAEGALTTQT